MLKSLLLLAAVLAPPFTATRVGSPADVAPPCQPGLLLMGGGPDVEEAFRWMLRRSGGGDILILRASGGNDYNPYLQGLGVPVNSVETVICNRPEASSDPDLMSKVDHAEAIFVAGGDQARYFELWQNTPLAQAVGRASRRCVVGGTSAGLAVLGEPSFSARMGTLTSAQTLSDPQSQAVSLEPGLFGVEAMAGTLTDSHFSQRQRMGRLAAFLGRNWSDGGSARGLGIDEGTALLVDGDTARVVGRNAVHFLLPRKAPVSLAPLEWKLPYARYVAGDSFSWRNPEPDPRAALEIHGGRLTP